MTVEKNCVLIISRVFFSIVTVCEILSTNFLRIYHMLGALGKSFFSRQCCAFMNLFAAIGFTVGKLYPAQYFCDSLDCNKVVHNAVMTLCLFVFDLADSVMLHMKQTDSKNEGTYVSQKGLVCKILNIIVSLAYVVYDACAQDAPGTGSTVLVVLACLSEAFLLMIEFYTAWRSRHNKS